MIQSVSQRTYFLSLDVTYILQRSYVMYELFWLQIKLLSVQRMNLLHLLRYCRVTTDYLLGRVKLSNMSQSISIKALAKVEILLLIGS